MYTMHFTLLALIITNRSTYTLRTESHFPVDHCNQLNEQKIHHAHFQNLIICFSSENSSKILRFRMFLNSESFLFLKKTIKGIISEPKCVAVMILLSFTRDPLRKLILMNTFNTFHGCGNLVSCILEHRIVIDSPMFFNLYTL